MPGKHDDRLPANHILVTGGTGSGKTTWVRKCKTLSGAKIQLLWDPDRSHYAVHLASKPQFLRGVRDGIRSGKPVRLALSVDATEDNFQWFCNVVWAACCASRPMVVVVEELAEVTQPGKAKGAWQTLLNRGRKYGVRIVAISQRPQEIDKTTLTQCSTKVTGALDRHVDRQVMARELSTTPEKIEELRQLNGPGRLSYLILQPGAGVAFQQINPKGRHTFTLPLPA